MGKEKLSTRTGKKLLKAVHTKINPDALEVIEKQVKKKIFPSRNSAINIAVEEKFLPTINKEPQNKGKVLEEIEKDLGISINVVRDYE